MSEKTQAVYRMNPAEDEILFGNEIAEGMWVLLEYWPLRSPCGRGEEGELRRQRFRRVMRLTRSNGTVRFIGEWVDGYQEVHSYAESWGWLVKKSPEET
jgi:hypothetical protein